jgi:hypothetical protein
MNKAWEKNAIFLKFTNLCSQCQIWKPDSYGGLREEVIDNILAVTTTTTTIDKMINKVL